MWSTPRTPQREDMSRHRDIDLRLQRWLLVNIYIRKLLENHRESRQERHQEKCIYLLLRFRSQSNEACISKQIACSRRRFWIRHPPQVIFLRLVRSSRFPYYNFSDAIPPYKYAFTRLVGVVHANANRPVFTDC